MHVYVLFIYIVVFATHEAASTAVEANGMMFGSHHLRIDFANNSTFDAKKRFLSYHHVYVSQSRTLLLLLVFSVFLGNIPTHATEEEVRSHFAVGLSEAASETPLIQGVRIIRDTETQVLYDPLMF